MGTASRGRSLADASCGCLFSLNAGRFDDRPPFVDLGLVEGVKRFRSLLVPREYLLADVGEPLAYRRLGERSTTAALSFATISFGVPLGTHSPCQNEMLIPGTPSSSLVGMSGAANQRVLANTA